MRFFRSAPRRDLALLLALLAAAGLWYGISLLTAPKDGAAALVSVDGETVMELPLGKDTQVTIQGAGGGENVLVVKNGEIWCSKATCPDKLCVRQGKKRLGTDTIVCLPNRMAVTIIEEGD